MENKQKEQARKEQAQKELKQNDLEKVSGGIVVPVNPDDPGHDGNSDDNGGGATGGW